MVVTRSKQVPVVVDFWAPWCGPCRTLGPLLERLADGHAGEFVVAKVNVDENQALAGAFGVQSIPMVLGMRGGEVAAEFVGALPETGVREFLSRLLPSVAEQLALDAGALYGAGKVEEAEAEFRRALEVDARCDRAAEAEALLLLEQVAPGTPERPEADRLAARIRVKDAGGGDVGELRARVASTPEDLDARFALAQVLASVEQYPEALDQYLAIVARDREFREDAARKAMLDVFDLLGAGDETVLHYRSELAKVLFR